MAEQGEPRTFRVSIPGEARFLKAVRDFFKPILREPLGEQSEMVILALDECCTNMLKYHAACRAGRNIDIEAVLDERRVQLRVLDFCHRDDISKIQPRELSDVRPGGLGTHFVQSIMDDVSFEPRSDHAGRVDLVLEKTL